MLTKISPCLWFNHQAEDAARFYAAIFQDLFDKIDGAIGSG